MLRHALRKPCAQCRAWGRAAPGAGRAWHGPGRHGRAGGAWSRTAKQPSAGRSPSNPWWTCFVTFSRDDGTRLTSASRTATQGCPDFLNARYGAENVLCAAIHRDETTSHLQVLIAARHEGGRLSSSKLMGNRTALSSLQDEFHESVAKPYRLLRGEKRTNAKHVPVRALYAAMNAGAELPDFRPVPPELTMGERLRLNGYQKEERKSSGSKRLTTTTHSGSF